MVSSGRRGADRSTPGPCASPWGSNALDALQELERIQAGAAGYVQKEAAPEERLDARNQSANAYIVKPADFEQLLRTMQSLEDFWITVVRYPVNKSQ